jgi:hypothetical protein
MVSLPHPWKEKATHAVEAWQKSLPQKFQTAISPGKMATAHMASWRSVASPGDNSKQCHLVQHLQTHPYQWLAEQCPWVSRYHLKDWFAAFIRKLPERWQWCSDLSGEYVECAKVWLCGCHHCSACIPGKSWPFLNDLHINYEILH